ncbi:MAG TPA: polyphosphate kinase, partial [Chitinophagaceae bacterium]|nr:polyphosphate kinase [Chitinophagaceae bacterium]
SHYEDVLVQRVHKWIDEETVKCRFGHINNFEHLLESTGTRVVKFYLHISHEEQLERLEERQTNPEKMWKHNDGDMKEREQWDNYMQAYEDVFEHCSKAAPWFVIPSDKNWYKEHLAAKHIRDILKKMDPQFPPLQEGS